MTHKVHPKAFRIKETNDWDSRGFYEKNFKKLLEEDFKIRKFFQKRIGKLGVEKIEIERFSGKINIIISSARPGLIIGRGGGGAEALKKELEEKVLKQPASAKAQAQKQEIKLEIREIRDPWTSATLSAQWIAQQIEKRLPRRRVLKQALEKIMAAKGAEGSRIEIGGGLDGVEIARTEWLKKGRVPRQTIRANIDYALEEALCTYGKIGIKVWIYKGEKFE